MAVKEKIEAELKTQIEDFSKETGLHVTEISLNSFRTGNGEDYTRHYSFKIRVSL